MHAGHARGQQSVKKNVTPELDFAVMHEAVREHRLSMLQRPKSAGNDKVRKKLPLSRFSIKNPPKCSEDLLKSGRTMEYKSGLDTFIFPTPLPHPEPQSATLRAPSPPFLDSPTSFGVGVAIGSPSQAVFPSDVHEKRAMPPNWSRSYTADQISSRMPTRAPPSAPLQGQNENTLTPQLERKKSLGWKALGSFFRRPPRATKYALASQNSSDTNKITSVHSSPYIDAQANSVVRNETVDPQQNISADSPSIMRSRSRLEARSRADRNSLMPVIESQKHRHTPLNVVVADQTWSPRDKASEAQHDSPLEDHRHGMPSTPRLDLSIPSPHMDRYSVMFETFLADSAQTRSSLLERRQSRLKRVKGLEDLSNVLDLDQFFVSPQNAALPRTSPASPRASHTPSLTILVREKRPGSTSPAQIISSDGPAMDRPRPIRRSNTAPTGAVSPVGAGFSKERRRFLPHVIVESPKTPLSAARFSEASLPPTPNTFNSCTDADDDEPEWEMLTSNRCLPTESGQQINKRSAQVSVARSVSMSQARARDVIESKQPLRPRVVDMGRNRKSTVAVVEFEDVGACPT